MARLEAMEKALYYPTPPSEIREFAYSLRLGNRKFRLFDPCVAEGIAVEAFAKALIEMGGGDEKYYKIEIVGVELEAMRAAEAAKRLFKVVHAPIERIAFHKAPGLIFMNPPYDDGADGRMELEWVSKMAAIMSEGSFMVLVIPARFFKGGSHHNELRMCLYRNKLTLAVKKGYEHYDDVEYFGGLRFSDEHYDDFKQVFLVVKKSTWRTRLMKEIPIDGIVGEVKHEIELKTGNGSDWNYEKEDKFDISARKAEPAVSVITDENLYKLFGQPSDVIPISPLMTMRPETVAAVIAGGMFSGVQLDREVIRGGITIRVESNVTDEGDNKTTEEFDVMVANLSILNLDTGEIQTWDSDSPEFGERISVVAKAVMEKLEIENPSIFQPEDLSKYRQYFSDIHAPRAIHGVQNGLFEPQIEKAATILKGWETLKSVVLIGEMGVGKSITSIAAAVGQVRRKKADAQKIMILVPAKDDLRNKWIEEINTSCRDIPHKVFDVETISDVQEAFAHRGLTFIVIKETMAKRTSGWEHISSFNGKRRQCFNCGERDIELVNASGDIIEREDETRYCPKCNVMFKRYVRNKNGGAYASLARYINDHYNQAYVLIVDEAHQFKGGDSARGYACASLIRSAFKTLVMTGTLYNGYASSIFYTLYRSQKSFRDVWAYESKQDYIRLYGLEKRVVKQIGRRGNHSWSGYAKTMTRVDEIPGIHPAMIAMMLPYTVFMKLDEFGDSIPTQFSHTVFLDLPKEVQDVGTRWLEKVRDKGVDEMKNKENSSMSLLSQFHWANKGLYDVYPMGDFVESPVSGRMDFGGMQHEKIAPKEEATLRIVKGEKRRGHPTLIYYMQTDRRPIHFRLAAHLERHGMKLAYMPSSEDKRVQFVRAAIKDGADAVLCNANLVREGIDLLEFKTIIWYGVTDDAILVNQANARNHRIGQDMETHVYYLGYNGTYQSDRWITIAKKVAAMSTMHGDVQQGIAALLGDKNLVATVQESLIKFDKAASDISLGDLPPLEDDADIQNPDVGIPVVVEEEYSLALTYEEAASAVQISLF